MGGGVGGGEVGAGGRLQLSLPVPPPPLLSAVAPSRQTPGGHEGSSYTARAQVAAAAEGIGGELFGRVDLNQLVARTPPPSASFSTSSTSDAAAGAPGAFWYSAFRPEGAHTTHLALSPPLLLANTSGALPLHYRCELLTDGEAWSSNLSAADSGTVPPHSDAPLRLSPRGARCLTLRMRVEGYSWCAPALTLDAAALDRIRQGAPLTAAVHATNRYGQRTELHVLVQPEAAHGVPTVPADALGSELEGGEAGGVGVGGAAAGGEGGAASGGCGSAAAAGHRRWWRRRRRGRVQTPPPKRRPGCRQLQRGWCGRAARQQRKRCPSVYAALRS